MTERGKAFQAVRAQVILIRSLKDQMRRAGTGDEKKYFDRKLKVETRRLIHVEREARKHMDNMKPEMYVFCSMYYINALSLDVVSEAIDRSTRQCARYKHNIENE